MAHKEPLAQALQVVWELGMVPRVGRDPPWEIIVTVGLPPVSEVELGGLQDLHGGVNKINKTPYISHRGFLNSQQKRRR